MTPHILIIGGGLAGTSLAWRLHERGLPFLIVDRDEPFTSSKVAAGLVTPITGMRLSLSWRFGELYPEALAFYRSLESKLGTRFYHEVPIVQLLASEKAVAQWQKRRDQPEVQPYLKAPEPGPLVNETLFANPHGGFVQQHSGWMDTAAFLSSSHHYFESLGSWQRGELTPDEVASRIGKDFTHAVFCIGWEAARHPWFDWVPFQSARGTVLQVSTDTGGETRVVNNGCWLLPRGDGTLRVGPTYELNFDQPHTPAPETLAALETRLRGLLKTRHDITGSQTGVRPIIARREALIGTHPARPGIAFMNGLGSKGVLRAPWVARQLVEHLFDGKPIEPELDLAGNL
jgi:glycine/D-amino acid oxidase-like deaminating enzyme